MRSQRTSTLSTIYNCTTSSGGIWTRLRNLGRVGDIDRQRHSAPAQGGYRPGGVLSAPSCARRSAIAPPMPRAAPVTTATVCCQRLASPPSSPSRFLARLVVKDQHPILQLTSWQGLLLKVVVLSIAPRLSITLAWEAGHGPRHIAGRKVLLVDKPAGLHAGILGTQPWGTLPDALSIHVMQDTAHECSDQV